MTDFSLAGAAADAGDRLALIAGAAALTFADLRARADRLRGKLALDRSLVAVDATSSVDTVVGLLALVDGGVPFVPIHPRLTAAERAALIADAGPARVLGDADFVDDPRSPPDAASRVATADTLAELYTSGTSGAPKAAVLPRSAFLAAVTASNTNLRVLDDDRWLLALPLCHVGGLSVLLRCLVARKPVVLTPRFDPDEVLAAVVAHCATQLSVVPTMLAALLERDRENVLARLRFVLVGGAACPGALLDECARRRVLALTTYGLTEACSQITCQPLRDPATREFGSGVALPGARVTVLDEAGAPCAVDAIGQIHVDGPMVFAGYRGRGPRRTPFPTGDLGSLDDRGRLHVAARRTDLVVTGGENVYPAEVERVIDEAPGVVRSLCFGVPDARWGALVAVAIVTDDRFEEHEFGRFVHDRLSSHRRPRLVARVSALPVTSLGKPDRRTAAVRLADRLAPLPRPPRT